MPPTTRRKWLATALVFSVQDRRNRARALKETHQRKTALMPLAAGDVARRLKVMHPPEEIMDSHDNEKDHNDNHGEQQEDGRRPRTSLEATAARESSVLYRPPMSYEQWLEEGFPVSCWRPLLASELYYPLEAEQAYLSTKYSLMRKKKEKNGKTVSD